MTTKAIPPFKNMETRGWKMDPWVKYLLHICKDLSLDPQNSHKVRHVSTTPSASTRWEVETGASLGAHWSASLVYVVVDDGGTSLRESRK